MTIQANLDNDINSIRRDWQVNPELGVLGFSSDALAAVFVNGRPGYWWVRQIQAGGTYGPPQQVRGCTIPMQTTPGTPVKLGLVESEKAVLGPDFVGMLTQGVNPTQAAVIDPNANNPSFVNQAFIATAYGQIVEGTLKVAIRGSVPLVAGVFVKFEDQADFTGNVPSAGNHCVAVIAVLSDLSSIEVQYSTAKSTGIPLDLDDLNEAWALMSDPLTNKPLWSFDIGDGITSLVEANKWMDNRQFLNWETPTSGTFYQTVQGNGTPATQEPIIDFINGTNTTITVTDDGAGTRTKVRVDATGSGDVVGPASAVSDDFAMYNGTTGKIIKDNGLSLSTDGTLAANSDSLIPSQKAVKTYADQLASGLLAKQDARLATVAALATNVYNNGSSGVGATLTGVATGVLTIDGVTVALNDRIIVKNEVAQANNGIYKCTVAGAIGILYVLTRTTDADTDAELRGAWIFATEGTNADQGFINTNTAAITFGTTAITFGEFSAGAIIAGTGLSKSGNTLSLQTPVALSYGGTNVDLSATGGATKVLAQDASHIISARDLIAADIPNLAASKITSGQISTARGGTGVDLSAAGSATAFLAEDGSHVVSARSIASADIATALTTPGAIGGTTQNAVTSTLDTAGQFVQGASQAATISASDQLTLTANKGYYILTSNTGTSDQLNEIVGGSGNMFVVLEAATGHTITINAVGANINLNLGEAFILSGSVKIILMFDSVGGKWTDLSTLKNAVAYGLTGHNNMDSNALLVGSSSGSTINFVGPGGDGQVLVVSSGVWSALSTVPASSLGLGTGDAGSGGTKGAVTAPATGDAVHGFFGDFTYAGTMRTLVAYTELGSDTANIDLTSISGSYKCLILLLRLRSDRAATNDNVYIRLNNDSTAANYYSYTWVANGTTPTFGVIERLAATGTGVEVDFGAVGSTGPTSEFSYLAVEIFGYQSTSFNKTVKVRGLTRTGTTTGNLREVMSDGWWVNTAAVTRLTMLPVTGANFKTGSAYMLLGVS